MFLLLALVRTPVGIFLGSRDPNRDRLQVHIHAPLAVICLPLDSTPTLERVASGDTNIPALPKEEMII